ncbi:MAG: DUF4185 domain-containing protein [Firmicutes bacterium]|nr:DUF4185 domain-containing protein [Bacillota bacterium]
MVKVPILNDELVWNAEQQWDVPLYFHGQKGTLQFGVAILNEAEEYGGEWVYVYGLWLTGTRKHLVVARTSPETFESVHTWRYWTGNSWSTNIWESVPIAYDVLSELSVSPNTLDPQGGWILVYGHGSLDHQQIALATAQKPFGPFSSPTLVYFCPEGDASTGTYAYNAKAHPILSSEDSLLVSYNVNARHWETHVWHADVYRPRFLWLRRL